MTVGIVRPESRLGIDVPVARFACTIGRPTVPIETYLRLMYLQHRYGLGYETLVKEVVADSLSWHWGWLLGIVDLLWGLLSPSVHLSTEAGEDQIDSLAAMRTEVSERGRRL